MVEEKIVGNIERGYASVLHEALKDIRNE